MSVHKGIEDLAIARDLDKALVEGQESTFDMHASIVTGRTLTAPLVAIAVQPYLTSDGCTGAGIADALDESFPDVAAANSSIVPAVQQPRVTILMYDRSIRSEKQQKLVMDGLMKLMLLKKNAIPVGKYVKMYAGIKVISEQLRTEFAKLHKVIVHKEVPVNVLVALKQQFESETSMLIHKSVVGLPTGIDILNSLDKAINGWSKDDALATGLVNVDACVKRLEAVSKERCTDKKGIVVCPDAIQWKKIAKDYIAILAKGSDMFRGDHAEMTGAIESAFKNNVIALTGAANDKFYDACAKALHLLYTLLSGASEVVLQTVSLSFETFFECVPNSIKMKLDSISAVHESTHAGFLDNFDSLAAFRKETLQCIKDALVPLVSQTTFDPRSEAMLKFANVAISIPSCLAGSNLEHNEIKGKRQTQLLITLRKMVAETFRSTIPFEKMTQLLFEIQTRTLNSDPFCDGSVNDVVGSQLKLNNYDTLHPFLKLFVDESGKEALLTLVLEMVDLEYGSGLMFALPFAYLAGLQLHKLSRNNWSDAVGVDCLNAITLDIPEASKHLLAMKAIKNQACTASSETLDYFDALTAAVLSSTIIQTVDQLLALVERQLVLIATHFDGSEQVSNLLDSVAKNGLTKAFQQTLCSIVSTSQAKGIYSAYKEYETVGGSILGPLGQATMHAGRSSLPRGSCMPSTWYGCASPKNQPTN